MNTDPPHQSNPPNLIRDLGILVITESIHGYVVCFDIIFSVALTKEMMIMIEVMAEAINLLTTEPKAVGRAVACMYKGIVDVLNML